MIFGDGVDIKSKIITKDDAKLYTKIKNMLDEDCDVMNPLARLIDYKVYNKLDKKREQKKLGLWRKPRYAPPIARGLYREV